MQLAKTWELQGLRAVILSQKDNIAVINGVPEITRPIAIELWNNVRLQALKAGLSLREKTEILHKDNESIVVEFRISVYLAKDEEGNPIPTEKQILLYEISEIGEAHRSEKGKEFTFVRTAYTRAMKRAMERLIGEDFINKTVLEILNADQPISEKQLRFIESLIRRKGLSLEQIEKKIGKSIRELTKKEAAELIERLKASS